MSSIMTMCLSQMVFGSTHSARHIVDLVFCNVQDDDDLGVEEPTVGPLSWTDHYLVQLRLTGTLNLWGGGY